MFKQSSLAIPPNDSGVTGGKMPGCDTTVHLADSEKRESEGFPNQNKSIAKVLISLYQIEAGKIVCYKKYGNNRKFLPC